MEISSEFKGALYKNTSGYFEKYFSEVQGLAGVSTIRKASVACSDLQTLVETKPPFSLLRWLSQSTSTLITGAATRFVSHELVDSNEDEAIALASKTASLSSTVHVQAVLVLGLLQYGTSSAPDRALSMFCEKVKSAFTRRPHRLFMHAFRIFDATLEIWTFDRAGGYCGPSINIIEHPNAFQALMNKYLCMNGTDLGLNPLVCENTNTMVLYPTATTSRNGTLSLSLDLMPLAVQESFMGAGTSCFKGHDMFDRQFAIKFEWSENTAQGEWMLLETAKARNVKGVVRLEAHQMLCTITSLRQGLLFTEPYILNESHGMSETERDRAALQRSPAELSEDDQKPAFDDLAFNCLVTSPLGQALDTFDTPRQLLTVLRDVVDALQSLYLEGDILHRDISPQNIVIVRRGSGNSSTATGMLIDLNVALDLSQPLEQHDLVGSEGFMAIGILSGHDHTYHHDRESVFYVFLWIAICHNGQSSMPIPDRSRLHRWMGTEWSEVLKSKRADMQPESFSIFVEKEFGEAFRPYLPLAHRLHALLFLSRGQNNMFIETDNTDTGTRQLYDSISEAFGQASMTDPPAKSYQEDTVRN